MVRIIISFIKDFMYLIKERINLILIFLINEIDLWTSSVSFWANFDIMCALVFRYYVSHNSYATDISQWTLMEIFL